MKNNKISQIVGLAMLISLSYMLIAGNVNAESGSGSEKGAWSEQIGINTIGQKAYGEDGQPADIRSIATNIVNVFLGLLSAIFLILVVVSGYKYMMAGGSEEKTREALGMLRTAVIGLFIILAAWGITYYVSSQVINATAKNVL